MHRGPPITVAIVEDNDVFREALEILIGLSPDLRVVVSVQSGSEALAALEETPADVALVDYRLPDLDGAATTRALRAADPELAVVALTAAADGPALEALREAGAVDCLGKDRRLEEIVAAIRAAAAR